MKICSDCQRCFEDEIISCSEENHESLAKIREGNCEVIENYRLDFLCESIATGETYRAVDTIHNKPCLIRIFPKDLFSETSRELFLHEAQILSSIIHPNIARVFTSGVMADNSVYVVMEPVTTQTLRGYLDQGDSLSEVDALIITRQAADGLTALHAVGVLHRNIQPENIILISDPENGWQIKLQNIDFGGVIQKINMSEQNLSDLKYFSPEQCSAKTVDAQTDVYSLGLILYEMLSGKPPFDASSSQLLIHQQMNETPSAVFINKFEIRALLTHTIADSLQKSKRLRLKSANVFSRRIRYIEQIATHSLSPLPAKGQFHTENHSLFKGKEIPAELLANLPTEELPPLESIIGELLDENETSTFNAEENHFSNNSISIDWEQPDDIPPMPKILENGDENFTSDFAIEPIFIDYEDTVIDVEPNVLPLDYLPSVVSQKPMNAGILWKFAESRKILISAGITLLAIAAIGAVLLNRQTQLSDDMQKIIAKSSPNSKESPKNPENDKSATVESEPLISNSLTSDSENSEASDLPDYQPREVSQKNKKLISHSSGKKPLQKTTSENCDCNKPIENKAVLAETASAKRVEVIIVGRTSANEKKLPQSVEMSIFNRPRIVKKNKL